jgi:hypothetical protein
VWGKTWEELNPGWVLKTHGNEEIEVSKKKEEISRAVNRSQISNLLRWEIINREGGVYVDTDFECLRPIDEIIDGVKCFVAKKKFSNLLMAAIFGSEAGAPLAQLLDVDTKSKNPSLIYELGSRYLTDRAARFNESEVKVFGPEFFCPIHHNELGMATGFGNAYAVHYWTSVTHNNLGFERLI